MPGRLGEPPSPPFYSPVSTHGAQAPQGGPAHSAAAAGTIGTLVLGAVQLREPLWGSRARSPLDCRLSRTVRTVLVPPVYMGT